jgi:hypothetical protein
MRPANLFLAALFLLTGVSLGFGKTSEPYQVGEKLTYHFYWGVFMVGRGVFEVKEGESPSEQIFRLYLKSNNVISTIYPIEDTIESHYDTKNKRTTRLMQDRSEGGEHMWEETFYDYRKGQAGTQSYISGETRWFDIPKDRVQDKISTVYYMRSLDWTKRTEASVPVPSARKAYVAKMTKLRTETIEIDDFKPISTFVIQPNTEYLSGVFRKGKMEVWISEDKFKVPIRVLSHLPIGTITIVLVKVQGVKDWPYDKKAN